MLGNHDGRAPVEPELALICAFLSRERTIWQGAPDLLWVPLARCDAGPGWHADTFLRGGQATPPPAPADDVPPWLLVGLKELFDPRGWLGEPAWFERMREAGA